jgi:glycosyltransferase involved in cell wall biosynthesis
VADDVVPGLAIDAIVEPTAREVDDALDGCELVVVENLLSLPLNPPAMRAVAGVLRDRPAVVRHHDLPWQRERFASWTAPPPTAPRWAHVTINGLSRVQLAGRGIEAITMYNRFAPPRPSTYRIDADGPVVLQPTRALPRKDVPTAVRLAERLGATYWLLGPAEDGYGPELERILAGARYEVRRGLPHEDVDVDDAYAAADVVAFPSTWEGFGNPTIESALARRPLVIGPYPVADELRAFGFRWFTPADVDAVAAIVAAPETAGALLDHNHAVATQHFALADLPAELARVLERVL